MEVENTVDVLICGAGAAGLTLAIDLARRGVSFRLIDKLDQPFAGSRGKGLQPRTLEVFEDLGIVDQILAAGAAYPSQRIHRDDGSLDESQSFANAPPTAEEPYRAPLMVPQFRTEAVMRERLAELGHLPLYGRELESFDQDTDGVMARLTGRDGGETLRCRYLVGADGGRSFVRHALGVGFPGRRWACAPSSPTSCSTALIATPGIGSTKATWRVRSASAPCRTPSSSSCRPRSRWRAKSTFPSPVSKRSSTLASATAA